MKIIQPPIKYKVLLIGDSCIDEYQYGTVNRISPEAPVPVFQYERSEERQGMVLNVRDNLIAHGVDVTLMTDQPGRKVRMVDAKSRNQLLRVDYEAESKPISLKLDIDKLQQYDCIVVSDYDKGYVTYELLEMICGHYDGPIYVDTKKKHLGRFKNCFIKINDLEAKQATTLPSPDKVIITHGSEGAVYNGKLFPSTPVEVSDVCGAGDTFLSALAYWHLSTGNMETAIVNANKAASITVKHFGTYAPRIEEYLHD